MNIEQRGFGITDISERVAGIDVEDGGLRIAMVANVAGDEALTPPITADDVKALIEALQAAHRLMTGDTSTPAPSSAEASLPDSVTDDQGDRWIRIDSTDRYAVEGDGRTLDWIRRNYGLSD